MTNHELKIGKQTEHKLKTTTVPIEQIISALKIFSNFNFQKVIKAFEGQDTSAKIIESEIALDEILKLIGLGFPPVAVVANDLEIAIDVEQVSLAIAQMLMTIPSVNNFVNEVSTDVVDFFTKDVPNTFNQIVGEDGKVQTS